MEMMKYPKIKEIGDVNNRDINNEGKIHITEKVDGTNMRFMFDDGEIVIGSRHRVITKKEEIEKMFKPIVKYLIESIDEDKINQYENLVFFGEGMVKHTVNYDWDKTPLFLGYDIYDMEREEFLYWGEVEHIFEDLNLAVVPYHGYVDCFEFDVDYPIPESKYYDGLAEGIVFKNYDLQIYAKKRSEEFWEKNKSTFGMPKKYAVDDNEKFVAGFCRNARIEKMIYKLRDDGEEIEMKMMYKLPNAVTLDIWEEEWHEICLGRWSIDTNIIRNMIAKRCLNVLRNVIHMQMYEDGDEMNE